MRCSEWRIDSVIGWQCKVILNGCSCHLNQQYSIGMVEKGGVPIELRMYRVEMECEALCLGVRLRSFEEGSDLWLYS